MAEADAQRHVDWDAEGDRYARTRTHITGTDAYERHVVDALADLGPGPVVDVGAGTGIWSPLLARWTGRRVVAVEPAAGMRRHAAAEPHAGVDLVAARADGLPLRTGTAAAAWMSAVLHHVGDIGACARELRRVLATGGPVLIRGAFAGRVDRLPQVRYFPGTRHRFDTFPSIEETEAAFGAAGFRLSRLEPVPEPHVDLREWRRMLPEQRTSDTSLVHLSDEEFAAGLAAIDADIAAGRQRDRAALDLLVLA